MSTPYWLPTSPRGVEYVFGGWIDVTGRTKSKAVPIAHLPNLLAGHERYTPRHG